MLTHKLYYATIIFKTDLYVSILVSSLFHLQDLQTHEELKWNLSQKHLPDEKMKPLILATKAVPSLCSARQKGQLLGYCNCIKQFSSHHSS
jgi:hypothetical protein